MASEASPAEPKAGEATDGSWGIKATVGTFCRGGDFVALPRPARTGKVESLRAGQARGQRGDGAIELGVIRVSTSPVESLRSLRPSARTPGATPGGGAALSPSKAAGTSRAEPQTDENCSPNKRPQPLTARMSPESGHQRREVHSVQHPARSRSCPATAQGDRRRSDKGGPRAGVTAVQNPKGARRRGG